jgi:hypothetical protein
VSGDSTYDELGPGLHRRHDVDPEVSARAAAARLGAQLCTTPAQVDAVITARTTAPARDVTLMAELQVVARRLARAERIAARTRERAVSEVGRRLTASSGGLAIHPTTVRERAATVQAARAELIESERALAAHAAALAEGRRTDDGVTASGHGAVAASGPDPFAATGPGEPMGPSLKDRRSRSIGAICVGFGVGLLLLGLGMTPLWVALLPVLAACLFALRYLPPREDDDDGPPTGYREESSRLLAQVSAATDEVFGVARPDDDAGQRTSLLTARRDRAQEELRVAQRAWRDLAGEEADVEDVEAVVRRFDPQHEDAGLLAAETAGVRAVQLVVHQLQQRWLALWAGFDREAPTAADAEAAVADLHAEVRQPIVLVGPAAERAPEMATLMPTLTIVVFDRTIDEPPDAPTQPAEIS